MSLMAKKRGLIVGVANERSLAWGIAQKLAQEGAELAFTYQGEALKKRVVPLAESLGSSLILPCDVCEEGALEGLCKKVGEVWETLDFVVHAVSFSNKNELRGDFLDTSKENFLKTMLVSCYSLIDLAKWATPLMKAGSSILTLSYYGAEKVVPNYNIMGVAKAALEASVQYLAESLGRKEIRVNALSSGPIRTLAASGIGAFHYILQWSKSNAPLRREITLEDVGNSACYLLSDLSSGVTGEILHVDGGYHVMGTKAKDSADLILPPEER